MTIDAERWAAIEYTRTLLNALTGGKQPIHKFRFTQVPTAVRLWVYELLKHYPEPWWIEQRQRLSAAPAAAETLVMGDPANTAPGCLVVLNADGSPYPPTATGTRDIEALAANVHDQWIEAKRAQGITSRCSESGEELMVAYPLLSEPQKEMDRTLVRTVLRAIDAERP